MFGNLVYRLLNLANKGTAEASFFGVVEISCVVQFQFGQFVKRRMLPHEKRARASRKTSSAWRVFADPESSSASRRTASSIQSRSISSAERSSRLCKSFCASLALAPASIPSAAASTSLVVIRIFLCPIITFVCDLSNFSLAQTPDTFTSNTYPSSPARCDTRAANSAASTPSGLRRETSAVLSQFPGAARR